MNTKPTLSRYDAIVVGARCAGAATARLLAGHGLRVLMLDRSAYGSDTLSTHALMRAGVGQLHRWGLIPKLLEHGTPPIRATSFHYGAETITVDIKERAGVSALYAPRRTVLDRVLVDAAREAGAEVHHGARVTDVLTGSTGRVRGVAIRGQSGSVIEVESDLVIGADGMRSTIARVTHAQTYRTAKHATAALYAYFSLPQIAANQWHYAPGISTAVIPTNHGQACIALNLPPTRFLQEIASDMRRGFSKLVPEAAPALADELARARRVSAFRGYVGDFGYFRQAVGPGWALVGDAGYFKDPITAHGITDALRDAELLARAASVGTERAFAQYQTFRDELSEELFDITDRIASFDWDMAALRNLHLNLSKQMNREVEALAELNETTADAA